jgi:hypothetical protein
LLGECKRVSPDLEIISVGVKKQGSNKLWQFVTGTPNMLVELIPCRPNQGTTADRCRITPNFYDPDAGQSGYCVLEVINALTSKLKRLWVLAGYNTIDWQSSIRNKNSSLEGLQLKIRTLEKTDRVKEIRGPVRCIVKLSCIYLAKNRMGLSWELVDLIPCYYGPAPMMTAAVASEDNSEMKESPVLTSV